MKKFLPVLLLCVVLLLPLVALVHTGLPLTHDGQDHVARIANFYRSLAEGNIIPRWAGSLNWGYGHPILMFLYPLPSYVASLFHAVGFSFVDSTKLVFAITMIASGLCMYLWLGEAYGKRAGIIGALLYVFAPYRFVDLYVRGALGEHAAFVFPPLILYFLLKLSRSVGLRGMARQSIGVAVSVAMLILAHNAIAIMFMPIIGAYGLYLLIFEAKNRWLFTVYCLLSIVLGFSLSAFFWIPAYFEGKYTLRDIVTSGEAAARFVPWTWFLYSPWNYGQGDSLTKSLGIMQWAGVVSAIALIRKSKVRNVRIILLSALGILLLSFFIMTSWSKPVWSGVSLLQTFQFPWRFLSVSVFAAAVAGGVSISALLTNSKKLFIAFCLLSVFVTVPMWHPKDYAVRNESFYSGIYPSTTDTGESSPVWSVRFMEHTPASSLEVIDGDATITGGLRLSTVHEYTVQVHRPTLFLENTVYFPDWKIYIDGAATQIQYQNPNYRGLMTFQTAAGTHSVRVVFENTKLRNVAGRISLAALAIIVLLGIWGFLWRKKR